MSDSSSTPCNFDAAADQSESAAKLMELWRSVSANRSMLNSSKICRLLWHRAFGDSSAFGRLVVVAYDEDISEWPKLKSGDDTPEVVFAKYDYQTHYNDTQNEFTLEFEFKSGDIVVILPSTNYQSSSLFGRGKGYSPIKAFVSGSDTNILLAGLCDPHKNEGRIVIASTCEDDIVMSIKDGARACLVNVQLEPQAQSYEGCVIVGEGSALRLVNCAICPGERISNGPHSAFYEDFDFQTSSCLRLSHKGYLLAEQSIFGPSSCSGIETEGKCIAILRECVIEKTGRGEDPEAKSDYDIVTQGEHSAIALSYACTLSLTNCTITKNYGYALQWLDANEEKGMTDQRLLDDGTPTEYAVKLAASRRDMGIFDSEFSVENFKNKTGIDIRTESGRQQLIERDTKEQAEELAEIPAKRERGSVVSTGCVCKANGRSIHLGGEAEEVTGSVTIQPWFQEGSRMKKVLDSRP